jgi:hypothetical protein
MLVLILVKMSFSTLVYSVHQFCERIYCVVLPYAPGVTAVFASDIVPLPIIGPPVKPVPVATEVTVPEPTSFA